MTMPAAAGALPSIAERIGPLLQRLPEADRPLAVAAAERLAAQRYRSWAERVASPQQRASLLACAVREEEIATRVESLHERAEERQRALLEANPELLELNRSLFADRPLEQQFRIQAAGERAGAGLWRALAQRADGHARASYEACARLEEESAELLETLLAAMGPPAGKRSAQRGAAERSRSGGLEAGDSPEPADWRRARELVRGARYLHTNVIARDWRALARFYQQVFGCEPVPPERDLSGPALANGTGVANARLRGVHLRLPGYGDQGPTLEIFQYDEQPAATAGAANRPGLAHLAFAVASVAEARGQVLAAGGSAVGEIVRTPVADGRELAWCYVRDPEGNILELQAS
jgi:catechol 2,3-dioxygenase-like lactoylglutathione lyase family enzyme